MARGDYVVTMFFKDDADGWSESHVWCGDTVKNVDDVMAEAISAGGLCELRCDLLGAGAEFEGVRVSEDGVWRDSRVEEVQSNSVLRGRCDNSLTNAAFPASDPNLCTRLRLEMGVGYRGVAFLSGLPQAIQPTPPLQDYPSPWNLAFNNYANYLANIKRTGTKWGSFVTSKPTAGNPAVPVSPAPISTDLDVTKIPAQLHLTLGSPLTGVKLGHRIRLLGVKSTLDVNGNPTADSRKWNGRFLVVGVADTTHITINIKEAGIAALPILDWSAANVFLPIRQSLTYDKVRWDGQSTHKRGRPSSARRGRR